jgi:hypothetical protein
MWSVLNKCGAAENDDKIVQSPTTPLAATDGQSIVPSYFETSTPSTVGPTPHTCVTAGVFDGPSVSDDVLESPPTCVTHAVESNAVPMMIPFIECAATASMAPAVTH